MEPQMNTDPCLSVILSRKSFAGRKGFFFAKSSRSSRLRGESWAGLSPRRREAREQNAKDFSLVAALLLCDSVSLWRERNDERTGGNFVERREGFGHGAVRSPAQRSL